MRPAAERAAAQPVGTLGRRADIVAWCVYDWAGHSYNTVIITFIFSVYFTRAVAPSELAGTAAWSRAISAAGIVVAVLSPVLGAIADRTGRRKPWLALFTLITIVGSALLWFVRPHPAAASFALATVVVSSVAFEFAYVFYNAMLPALAPRGWLGRLSGWGWSIGYAGGLCCLVLALFVFVQAKSPPFGLPAVEQGNVRATALLVAGWYGLFSLPLFVLTPDEPGRGLSPIEAMRGGLAALARTVRQLGGQRSLIRFLIASAAYRDGLATLIAFGGIYAAGTFGMSFGQIVIFAIALNASAGLGAAAFAWVDDRIGAKPTIMLSLVGLIGFGAPTLLIHEKLWFWVLVLGLGIFIGPVQASGRSLMARLAPPGTVTEMFGLSPWQAGRPRSSDRSSSAGRPRRSTASAPGW